MTEKENAPAMTEAQGDTATPNPIAPGPDRALFHPLTWRCDKPAQPRSEYGRTTPEALAWLAFTGLMMLAGWLWEAAR